MERYVIQGYEFSSREEAMEAKKELAAVTVLSQKVQAGTPEDALKIYERVLNQQLFHTPIGIDYLKNLKQYLVDNNVILDTTTEGLTRKVEQLTAELEHEKKKNSQQITKMRELLNSSLIFSIVLIIIIVAMIFISSSSDNPTILNYEQKIQDRYAGWEQELESREQAVKEMEKSIAAQEVGN